MPNDSHYKAAIADDDEYAEQVFGRYGPPSKDGEEDSNRHLTMQGYSMVVSALHEIADRVGALYAVTVAVNSKSGKAPDVPTMPRPQTARERYQANAIVRRHHQRVRQVLPSKGGNEP